ELAGFAGDSLGDDFGVFVDQDRHLQILGKFLFGGSYDFLRSFGHGVGADDGQAGIGQQLLAQLFVGTLHAHHQWNAEVDGLARSNDALGDDVAAHDATEDVDQNGLDAFVLEHDLERFCNLFGRCTTTDVEEVGRLATEQLDGVHGSHGQAGAVYQAADVAVELNIRQVKLAGFELGGIFFVQVAIFNDFGVTEQRVGIEVEFGVQSNDVAIAVAVQGVDRDQRCVGFHVALIKLLEHVG